MWWTGTLPQSIAATQILQNPRNSQMPCLHEQRETWAFRNELVRINIIQFSNNVCIADQLWTRNREYVINAFKSHSLVVHISFEMKQICMMCPRHFTHKSISQIRHNVFNILFLRIIALALGSDLRRLCDNFQIHCNKFEFWLFEGGGVWRTSQNFSGGFAPGPPFFTRPSLLFKNNLKNRRLRRAFKNNEITICKINLISICKLNMVWILP